MIQIWWWYWQQCLYDYFNEGDSFVLVSTMTDQYWKIKMRAKTEKYKDIYVKKALALCKLKQNQATKLCEGPARPLEKSLTLYNFFYDDRNKTSYHRWFRNVLPHEQKFSFFKEEDCMMILKKRATYDRTINKLVSKKYSILIIMKHAWVIRMTMSLNFNWTVIITSPAKKKTCNTMKTENGMKMEIMNNDSYTM